MFRSPAIWFLIVVFSGYENFVSRIDPRGHPDWPEWMTRVDRRAEAEAARLDRCDLGDPGFVGVHEHRRRLRRPEDGLAGRHSSRLRDLDLDAGAVRPLGRRSQWRVANTE